MRTVRTGLVIGLLAQLALLVALAGIVSLAPSDGWSESLTKNLALTRGLSGISVECDTVGDGRR